MISFLGGANIWFWFRFQYQADAVCASSVFFFGRTRIDFGDRTDGRLVVFFKAASIIIAVPIFTLALTIVAVAVVNLRLLAQLLHKHWLLLYSKKTPSEQRSAIESRLQGLLKDLDRLMQICFLVKGNVFHQRGSTPSVKDLIKAYIFFSVRSDPLERSRPGSTSSPP